MGSGKLLFQNKTILYTNLKINKENIQRVNAHFKTILRKIHVSN